LVPKYYFGSVRRGRRSKVPEVYRASASCSWCSSSGRSICTAVGLGTVGGMKRETPRTPDGAKLCAWCGGTMRQTGVGRSRDYCSRTHKEYAYRARRDRRLVDEALAAVAAVSTTAVKGPAVEPVSAVVETGAAPIPAQAPADPVLPDAWRAPVPAVRRPLSRSRSGSADPAARGDQLALDVE
jgi:hypothetical protein